MPEEDAILEIDPAWRRGLEQLGSKPKFWFRYQDEDWLFKAARANTGEHWAEKVASEVAELLGLSTHRVVLASYEGEQGCAVRSFLSKHETLVHGNELLAGTIEGYDKDKQRGQADHHFANIVKALEYLFPEPKRLEFQARRFVGYLVLDGLVGNTDRHHENWGVVLTPTDFRVERPTLYASSIAPTFDHASSLGRELLDERRLAVLEASDGLTRYIRKAKGGIFEHAGCRKGLSPIGAVEKVASDYGELFKPWRDRLSRLDPESVSAIVERIPGTCMSETAKTFTLAFLEETRRLILQTP